MESDLSQAKKWAMLIRKIWDDPSLKDVLLSDPHKFLKENGFEISETQTLEIHENTDSKFHLVIPQKPPKELSDEVLSHIVAGLHYS